MSSNLSCIVVGNESLTQQCAAQLLKRGHTISVLVSNNFDVLKWAEDTGIRTEQPGKDLHVRCRDADCDWILSIANLSILPDDFLALATKGAINFHDALLPSHAGLNAPVWAMLAGETEHGVTWHIMEAGVDKGDIVAQKTFAIHPHDTALTMNTKCYEAGLESFPTVMSEMEQGLPSRRQQDLSQRNYHAAGKRPFANGLLDFGKPAGELELLVRALDHRPYWNPLCTPKILMGSDVVNVASAKPAKGSGAPGTVIAVSDDSITVATSDSAIELSGLTRSGDGAVDVQNSFSIGQVLNEIAPQTLENLDKLSSDLARHDGYWRKNLANFNPLRLPFQSGQDGAIDAHDLDIDAEHLPKIVRALISRLSDHENADVALAHDVHTRNDIPNVLHPWVPLRLTDGDVESVVEQTMSKGAFAADLFARDAGLENLGTPDIGISMDAGFIADTGITFVVSGDDVALHADTSRISPLFADVLLRRIQQISNELRDGKENPGATLPDEELKLVSETYNQTSQVIAGPKTVHQAFEQQVQNTPDLPAVAFEDREVSYAGLNKRANHVANVLLAMGVETGDFVGLHCHRNVDMIAAALGIMKAGAAYVPLDPEYPDDRIDLYLKDSGAKVVLSESELSEFLPNGAFEVLEIDNDPRLSVVSGDNPDVTVSGDDLAYMIYTSGSTGKPKGVMVEHGNVANFFAGMDAFVAPEIEATWLAVTSLSFDISVLELFYTLTRGFKVVIPTAPVPGAVSGTTQQKTGEGVDFSLYYWGNDDGVGRDKYKSLLEGAQFADQHGFCAVWTPERHFHAFGGPYPNPSVTGAAVAAVTNNLSVRAGSCVAPLHHPARICEEWAVIDNLTNGRAGLAIASGWQPDDFVLRPENTPPDNKPAMMDSIDIVRRLWRGEAVPFQRKDGSEHEVVTQPRPVSSELPIWVTTAGNPETWREAGRIGANVLTHLLGQSVAEVGEKIKIYHEALQEAGHNPDDFQITLMLHTFIAETRDIAREVAREPMKDYLRSAAGLIKQYAWAFPAFKKPEGVNNAFELDLGSLSEDELEGILDFAFERYFNDSGLFGTVTDAIDRANELSKIGVSEIACLIDYGIPVEQVLDGLRPLAQVVKACAPGTTYAEDDFSIAAMIEKHAVTHLQCTPSMVRMLTSDDVARAQLRRIKHLFVGGEALPGALVDDLQSATSATITNMYGPTETTIWSSCEPVTGSEAIVNIGNPIANTQLYVLDEDMALRGVGEAGELWIGGDGVTRGYWHRDDLTEDRFRPNPFAEGRMYRTGDLVRRRLDGKLDYLGRTDHQVKLRGFRIELGEIEAVMQSASSVTNAAVVTRPAANNELVLIGYYEGPKGLDSRIRSEIDKHLPDYMSPSKLVQMDQFPLTPNKKVDRNALPDPSTVRPVNRPVSANTSPNSQGGQDAETLRAVVSGIWSEVLGVGDISPRDNFFELGGHSLLAVQTHRIIRDRMNTSGLSITDIFQYPTLGALSDRLAALQPAPIKDVSSTASSASEPAQEPQVSDRAQQRKDAMSKRRMMRARRSA